MKLRVLSYGVNATHQSLTMLPTIWAPVAISDFDAFVYDPHKFVADSKAGGQSTGNQSFREDENGTVRACLNKHSYEVAELLGVKGGVVIVLLRPSNHTFHARYYGCLLYTSRCV